MSRAVARMGKDIKLLYLIDEMESIASGGTERQLLQHVAMLNGNGFDVQVCILRNTAWLCADIAGCPVKRFHFESIWQFRGMRELWKMFRWLRSGRFDIVHTFFVDSNLLGPILARLAGVRVIVGGRRNLNRWMNGSMRVAQAISSRFVTSLAANSEVVKRAVCSTEFVGEDKVAVIYNGIDVANFTPNPTLRSQSRQDLGIKADELAVLNTSCLRTVKGIDIFLRAAAMVCSRRHDIRFVIVGDGPARGELELLTAHLGITRQVTFVGSMDNVNPYLQACDIGVLSSHEEGFSNSLLEYMSSGLACIATDVGGNAEALGGAGLLVPSDAPEKLADAILRVSADAGLRLGLCEAARRRASYFGLDRVRPRLVDFYDRLLRQRSGPLALRQSSVFSPPIPALNRCRYQPRKESRPN